MTNDKTALEDDQIERMSIVVDADEDKQMSKWGEGDINQWAEQYLLHYRSHGSGLSKEKETTER